MLGLVAVHRPGLPLQRGHSSATRSILTTFFQASAGPCRLLLRGRSPSATSSARCCSAACSTRVGRKPMIAGTYIAVRRAAVRHRPGCSTSGRLTRRRMTACWCVVFFFASAGASSAYLTVSEIFPMETRAMAIALLLRDRRGLGGVIGPQVLSRDSPETRKLRAGLPRIRARCGDDDLLWSRGDRAGCGGRAPKPREHRPATDGRGLIPRGARRRPRRMNVSRSSPR